MNYCENHEFPNFSVIFSPDSPTERFIFLLQRTCTRTSEALKYLSCKSSKAASPTTSATMDVSQKHSKTLTQTKRKVIPLNSSIFWDNNAV
jgi:hypothetical protein